MVTVVEVIFVGFDVGSLELGFDVGSLVLGFNVGSLVLGFNVVLLDGFGKFFFVGFDETLVGVDVGRDEAKVGNEDGDTVTSFTKTLILVNPLDVPLRNSVASLSLRIVSTVSLSALRSGA